MKRRYSTILAALAVAAGLVLAVFEWNRGHEAGLSYFWMTVAVLLVLLGMLELMGVRHERDGGPR